MAPPAVLDSGFWETKLRNLVFAAPTNVLYSAETRARFLVFTARTAPDFIAWETLEGSAALR